MPRVRFDGPAHRLIVRDRNPIPRGGFFTVTDEELKSLQSQKNIRLTVIKAKRQPQEPEARKGEGQPVSTDPQEE